MYVAVKEFENDSRPAKWEAQTLSKLRHPNIVMFIGCEFERAPYLLVTRYIGHPRKPPLTIHSALTQGTFTQLVPFWVRVLTQVADALLYLHVNARVIHNDLKTDNVVLEESLVDEDGVLNATVIDFGRASVIGMDVRKAPLGVRERD